MSDQLSLLQKHFDTALESPDGIKNLRELILTLAMQGKLVKQDPKDQPANELLKEIQAEKERLIKEGKIKKQKELPPIKPEEVPYQVPDGWEWVRLGEIVTQLTDGTHHTPTYVDSGIPFLSVKDMSSGVLDFSATRFISQQEHEELKKRCYPQRGDLLLTKVGTTGIPVLVNTNQEFSIFVSVALIKYVSKYISGNFLVNLINSPLLKKQSAEGTEGVGNKNLVLRKINVFIFPLPPLAEQKRIVARIDELMALCDKLEAQRNARNEKRLAVHTAAINRLLTAAEKSEFDSAWQFITRHFDPLYSVKEDVDELKKAILTLAMQGKLVKQDPKDQPASELLKEIQAEKERLIKEGKIKKQKELPPIKPEGVPYEVPEGWVWTRLGEIGETQTGTTPSTKDADNFGDYIPFIGPGDILNQAIVYNNNGLSEKGINKSRLIQKFSILMVCIGGSIGKHAINTVDVACNQQINTITPFTCDVKYLFYSMWSDDFQNNVVTNAGGSATPIINKNKWSMILIPLPPLAEQKRIVAKIDELMVLCDRLENQIEQATAKQTDLFDAVLAKV